MTKKTIIEQLSWQTPLIMAACLGTFLAFLVGVRRFVGRFRTKNIEIGDEKDCETCMANLHKKWCDIDNIRVASMKTRFKHMDMTLEEYSTFLIKAFRLAASKKRGYIPSANEVKYYSQYVDSCLQKEARPFCRDLIKSNDGFIESHRNGTYEKEKKRLSEHFFNKTQEYFDKNESPLNLKREWIREAEIELKNDTKNGGWDQLVDSFFDNILKETMYREVKLSLYRQKLEYENYDFIRAEFHKLNNIYPENVGEKNGSK